MHALGKEFEVARIYSNIFSVDCGDRSIYVGTLHMRNLTNVRLVRSGGLFGNYLVVTHRNCGDHVVKQQDRGYFWVEGRGYTGEAESFADAVRLLNGM